MNRSQILEEIQKNVTKLSTSNLPEYKYIPLHQKPSPSVDELKKIIFPGFFGTEQEAKEHSMEYYMGVHLEQLYDLLQEQIFHGLCFEV